VTLLDDRGRLAGRFNVVDAIAAIVLIVAIPVAYAAYRLFRTPTPTLASVVPATLFEGARQRIEIDGTNLRPFMRVTFNTTPARAFLLGSTKYALVDLPDLKPGAYDVVLYDYMQEVARLPKALTIAPVATDVELELVGAFKSPAEALMDLKVGDRFPPTGNAIAEVLAVGAPVSGDLQLRVGTETLRVASRQQERPATLRVRCYSIRAEDGTARCVVPAVDAPVTVAPDALLMLSTLHGPVLFQIAAARAPGGTASKVETK
jgi:hypothetical protein